MALRRNELIHNCFLNVAVICPRLINLFWSHHSLNDVREK